MHFLLSQLQKSSALHGSLVPDFSQDGECGTSILPKPLLHFCLDPLCHSWSCSLQFLNSPSVFLPPWGVSCPMPEGHPVLSTLSQGFLSGFTSSPALAHSLLLPLQFRPGLWKMRFESWLLEQVCCVAEVVSSTLVSATLGVDFSRP